MTVAVRRIDGSHRLDGTWAGTESANAFLSHLEARRFSPATVRAYAFDIVCLARFLEETTHFALDPDQLPTRVDSLIVRRFATLPLVATARAAATP